jgi:Mobilization protein NikA
MQLEKKYNKKPEQNIILNLDLSLDHNFLEIDFDAQTLNDDSGISNGTEISSRCVFVATKTTLSAPDGRRVKKSGTAKKEIIKFRCTLYEKKILKIKAKKSGLTLSEYCRKVVFEEKITERLTDEQIEIYKMLVSYHNNFKSIGNMFHKRNPELTKTVIQLADEIKIHLKKFES